jgi:DNA ligase-4
VDTSVFTTFYIGVLTNHDRVKARIETPHFEFLFRASYGMDRSQLEVYNENVRMGRWRSKPFDRDDPFKKVSDIVRSIPPHEGLEKLARHDSRADSSDF